MGGDNFSKILKIECIEGPICDTLPIRRAALLAFTLNWFSMSFGKKAANPAIRSPSLAPARFRKKKVGLAMRLRNARGSSLILVKASILLLP